MRRCEVCNTKLMNIYGHCPNCGVEYDFEKKKATRRGVRYAIALLNLYVVLITTAWILPTIIMAADGMAEYLPSIFWPVAIGGLLITLVSYVGAEIVKSVFGLVSDVSDIKDYLDQKREE